MVQDHGRSIRDEALRPDGTSKQEAVPIVSSPGASERGGEPVAYEEWSKAELYERAQAIGIVGRSSMSKSELITALRAS